jgi:hypothetical protein
MAGPSADHITEWEGGSLSELVAMLQAAALPVRIEVIAPGTTDSSAGEVHLLAGGLADAFAGSLRRDDAMAALQRLEGARYVIECRLPNPESGSLSEPGPQEGSLKDRTLASLMRYCEEYVLSCRLEVWRGEDRAVISYRRGEIIGTNVGDSEGSDRLPEVLAWTDGAYEIILPTPVLPQTPSRGRDGAVARADRKRHSTLPMIQGTEGKPDVLSSSRIEAGAKNPHAGTGAAGSAPTASAVARPAASGPASQSRPGSAQPAQPAIPTVGRGVSPPSTTTRPAPQTASAARPPLAQASAQQPPDQPGNPAQPGAAAQKISASRAVPAAIAPKPGVATVAAPLQPEATTRGTPPVPAVPLVPAPAQQPAARPTMQGTGVPLLQPKPTAPPQTAAPAAQPAPQPAQKPAATQPKPSQKPAASQPAPPPPQKPAVAQPAAQPLPKASPPAIKPNPPAQAVATAPAASLAAQPMLQSEKPPGPPALPSKPAASNDLSPASGTIEAKPKHANYLPPTTAPIQIADEPQTAPPVQPPPQVVAQSPPPQPQRARGVAHKKNKEHPVRAYVFLGLAIGVGIVLAYWAYWYLPFGHH